MSTSDVDVDVDVDFKIILRITPRALVQTASNFYNNYSLTLLSIMVKKIDKGVSTCLRNGLIAHIRCGCGCRCRLPNQICTKSLITLNRS